MSGSRNHLEALIDKMMEQLQRENPHVNYKRKQKAKPCKKPKNVKSVPPLSSLH